MAVHKVPQDVEADDKFLGPLSFKQFLFAGGVTVFGYLSYVTITTVWFISPVFIIPTLGFAALAFPWSKEQPTELWLAARIRFLIKPHKRIWDQSGVKELVKINVPKQPTHLYTDGLSQSDVHSRLNALASMVDSRGWASKHAGYTSIVSVQPVAESDRLLDPIEQPIDEQKIALQATEDVLDPARGTIARQFDNMIQESEKTRKTHNKEVVEHAREFVNQAAMQPQTQAQQQDFWFMTNSNQAAQVIAPATQANPVQTAQSQPPIVATPPVLQPLAAPVTPQAQQTTIPAVQQAVPIQQTTVPPAYVNPPVADPPQITQADEAALLEKAHEQHRREVMQVHPSHEKNVLPLSVQQELQNQQAADAKKAQEQSVPPHAKPDILQLATSNDLNIETLAREAKRKQNADDNEVIISLH